MAFHRRWLLILFALMLGGESLFAATREDRAYAAAVQAFNDKVYPLAESKLNQFLQTYHKSTNAPMAMLLLAESEYYQKNYADMISRLTDPGNVARARMAGLADRYVYWEAEAQYASGDYGDAARSFLSLIQNFPESPQALSAAVEAASAFGQAANWGQVDVILDNTNGVFQRMARLDPASGQVADGRLWQAESKFFQQEYTEARSLLALLNPAALTPEQDWRRTYLLYQTEMGLNELEAAMAAATNLMTLARTGQGVAWATNRAESIISHASVLEKQGRLADAEAALAENLTNGVPAAQQQQTILELAKVALLEKNTTNAEAELESFPPDAPAAGTALLTLGELYLKDYIAQPSETNRLAAAQRKLDQFVGAFTNSPLLGRAYLARGWCGWVAGQAAGSSGDAGTAAREYALSLDDFSHAAEHLPMSGEWAVARFKMGDAQFALNDFAGAQTNYGAVLTNSFASAQATNSLASRALYQILRARLAGLGRNDEAGMNDLMGRLLGEFFTNAPLDSVLLLAGEQFSDFGSPTNARALFEKFKDTYTNSWLLPQVEFAIGRTYEEEQNWAAAAANDEAWLKKYPANDLRPKVEYEHDWAVWQTGDEAAAFQLFSQYPTRYPTNALETPLAYWWLGDHYFRQGTNLAELNYEHIFQDFPTNPLAYPAQLMAGRAALARNGYNDAKRYFLALISTADTNNCPEDLRDRARFGYCEALVRQITTSDTNNGNLQQVTTILAEMYPKAATNIVGALAWNKTGDCDLQLGDLDDATNAYAQVLSSPAASAELRSQAEVSLGVVLEKKAEGQPDDVRKALLNMAMDAYGKAFYSDAETKDAFWTKKAGFQMLALARKTGILKGDDLDNFIRRLKTMFPQLQDSPELKRLASKD